MGRWLIIAGLTLAAAGGLIMAIDKLGLGQLPGDIVWKRKNFTVYFPIATSLLISIALTLILNIVLRKK